MPDIAKAVTFHLASDPATAQAIGTRFYPAYNRQVDRVYPLAVYQLDVSPVMAFDGPTGTKSATLEIAAVAASYADAVGAAAAILAALDGQRGTWGPPGAQTVVQGCFVQDDGERDDKVTDPTSEAILFYVKVLRFDLVFNS